MNTSSDSSSLADCNSSSAEAICEAVAASTGDCAGIPRSHSTPQKPGGGGLHYIMASNSEDDEIIEIDGEGASKSGSKCETTFSRTTGGGYPNCGTYFVQHISEDEGVTPFDNGPLFSGPSSLEVDENYNSSSAYASPNSIRRLVNGAEELVHPALGVHYPPSIVCDDSDVDYRTPGSMRKGIPKGGAVAGASQKYQKQQRSHSFHSNRSLDHVITTSEDEMDCGRDSLHNLDGVGVEPHSPLKDASSLSQLVDSVVADVQQSLMHEAASLTSVTSAEDAEAAPAQENGGQAKNEEEELSEYWDQVSPDFNKQLFWQQKRPLFYSHGI